jgi:hypothetical protein
VLIYEPARVLRCDNLLPLLQVWRESHPDRFALILSRPPKETEPEQMDLLRLTPDGTLRRTFL